MNTRLEGSDLIGTKHNPAGWEAMRDLGAEANAYHTLNPYPFYHFQDWMNEQRGPLPKCLPVARDIVRKGSKWLLGQGITLDVADNPTLQERLRECWSANQMKARAVRMAEMGGVWGAQVLSWTYDPDSEEPVSFRIDNPKDARLYWDPADRTRLLMVRYQYLYLDQASGEWKWFREEWTDDRWVKYKPVKAEQYQVARPHGFLNEPENDKWVKESDEPNQFGIVPAWCVRNSETESPCGEGDLWSLFRILDRVHLVFHLMDKSNQFDSEPNKVYIDANIPPTEVDRPAAPGQSESIKTEGEGRKADVKLLEPKGSLRPAMREYANDLLRMIRQTAGSVELNSEEITNKGHLTRQVLSLIFQPLIEATEQKKELYGEDGIAKFLQRLCKGMAKVKEKGFEGADKADVKVRFPDYFPLTPEEKQAMVQYLQSAELAGLESHDRAVNEFAEMEGIEDVDALRLELEKDQKERDAKEAQDEGQMAASLKDRAVKRAQA